MAKQQVTELISLFGTDPIFQSGSPRDFTKITPKTFLNQHSRLTAANQFKNVWSKSKESLAALSLAKSKTGILECKNEVKNTLEVKLDNSPKVQKVHKLRR